MVLSTFFTQPKLQLSACASDINSTTNCASSHQKASAQSQTARNSAMSGGGGQIGGSASNPMAGLMTVSQGPASAGGSVPASPTTGNGNMVGTTQTSVGAQSQTQFDSAVNTTGKIPSSSSPRANKNPPLHESAATADKVPASTPTSTPTSTSSQHGGGILEEEKEKFGSWLSRLNHSIGGAKYKKKSRKKKKKKKQVKTSQKKRKKHIVARKRENKKLKRKLQDEVARRKALDSMIRKKRQKVIVTQAAVAAAEEARRRAQKKDKAAKTIQKAVQHRRTQKRHKKRRRTKIRAVSRFAHSLRKKRRHIGDKGVATSAIWNKRCDGPGWLDFDLSSIDTATSSINGILQHTKLKKRLDKL